MTTLLELDRVVLPLGEFRLGPISLDVEAGDYVVLLGPSGCGKTTLLRTIAGLYRPEAGTVRVGGRDVTRLAPHHRRLGYVSQTSDLFPHLDVAGNIAFGLAHRALTGAEKRARLDRITDLVGVRHLLGRRTDGLSGGESKRVALARSLVIRPAVLLLDEPLGMLDPLARRGMIDVLRTIHDELGTAAVHVTHDREEAWALEGRCAVMREGRLVQQGTVSDLFRRPNGRFVAEFLGGSNFFAAQFVREGAVGLAVLGWGELKLDEPVDFAQGFIHIRPETLVPAPPDVQTAASGEIRALHDRGIYCEVIVAVDDGGGATLLVHVTPSEAADLAVGGRIHLRCTARPHALAAEDAPAMPERDGEDADAGDD